MSTTNTIFNGNTNGWNSTNTTNSAGHQRVRFNVGSSSIGSGGCNESSKHDNDEKALFHGLKSAYRMSREYDGAEYGSESPQHEAAAGIAANVALAYLQATDTEYDRQESFEYLREKVVGDPNTIDRILSVFGIAETRLDDGLATESDLEDGIARAWTQADGKGHHDDAARTALAIAEAYLGEENEVAE